MKHIIAAVSGVVILCIIVGLIAHFTGLNIGEMIVTGFNSLKHAFTSLF